MYRYNSHSFSKKLHDYFQIKYYLKIWFFFFSFYSFIYKVDLGKLTDIQDLRLH